MTVPVTAMKLGLAGSIVAIHWSPMRFSPSSSRVRKWVRPPPTQANHLSTTRQDLVGSRLSLQGVQVVNRQGLTQGKQVQGIGVIVDDSLHGLSSLAVLGLAELGLVFPGVTMEDDGGSAYHVILKSWYRSLV